MSATVSPENLHGNDFGNSDLTQSAPTATPFIMPSRTLDRQKTFMLAVHQQGNGPPDELGVRDQCYGEYDSSARKDIGADGRPRARRAEQGRGRNDNDLLSFGSDDTGHGVSRKLIPNRRPGLGVGQGIVTVVTSRPPGHDSVA